MSKKVFSDIGRFFNYFVIYFTKPDYLKEILAFRKGSCTQCGNCCRNAMSWGIKCPFLRGNLCGIHKYKKSFLPLKILCGLPPYKGFRIEKGCGYYWDEPVKK